MESVHQPTNASANRRTDPLLIVWRICIAFLIIVHLFPIRFGLLRLLMVAVMAAAWVLTPIAAKNKTGRIAWAASTAIMALLFFGPARPVDKAELRQQYVNGLRNYLGTRYIWGGENARGVDCSGLVRIGLIDADFRLGVTTLNPALVREGASLWWHDCSALALKQEYRQNTRAVMDVDSLNDADYARLLPGDICVTENGEHTLAFIGNKEWIEADPAIMKVHTITAPSKDIFFNREMRILRWRQLNSH